MACYKDIVTIDTPNKDRTLICGTCGFFTIHVCAFDEKPRIGTLGEGECLLHHVHRDYFEGACAFLQSDEVFRCPLEG